MPSLDAVAVDVVAGRVDDVGPPPSALAVEVEGVPPAARSPTCGMHHVGLHEAVFERVLVALAPPGPLLPSLPESGGVSV